MITQFKILTAITHIILRVMVYKSHVEKDVCSYRFAYFAGNQIILLAIAYLHITKILKQMLKIILLDIITKEILE